MNITFYGGFNSMLRKEGIEKALEDEAFASLYTVIADAYKDDLTEI